MTDPFIRHGGALAAAIERFGQPAPWLDLSTGINPHPFPVASVAIDWTRLPDAASLAALEAAAARCFGCDPRHLCALPGTEAGLRLVGEMLPRPAYFRIPCYSSHHLPGARPLAATDLGQADGATLLLANPNNPDGRLAPADTMRHLLERRGATGLLLVDEAYADCHPGESLAALVADNQPLLVLRSFGKFFGLPGLRLGFLLGPAAFVERLRQRLGSWPVSAAAIAIGTAAYGDGPWMAATRRHLAAAMSGLDAVLATAGLSPSGACPLFRLVRCSSARRLFEHLAGHAILTRPFAAAPQQLRIGLPADGEGLTRLAAALATFAGDG